MNDFWIPLSVSLILILLHLDKSNLPTRGAKAGESWTDFSILSGTVVIVVFFSYEIAVRGTMLVGRPNDWLHFLFKIGVFFGVLYLNVLFFEKISAKVLDLKKTADREAGGKPTNQEGRRNTPAGEKKENRGGDSESEGDGKNAGKTKNSAGRRKKASKPDDGKTPPSDSGGKALVKNTSGRLLNYKGERCGVGQVLWIPIKDVGKLEEKDEGEIIRAEKERVRPEILFKDLERRVANVKKPFIKNIDPDNVTEKTPPAQRKYLRRRLKEERRKERIENIGDPEKYGDWRPKTSEQLEEKIGKNPDYVSKNELSYIDQLMVSLSEWGKFKRSPTYTNASGKPESFKNPTETPGLTVARRLLEEKHDVKPTEFRLLSTMPYTGKGADLEKIKRNLCDEAHFNLNYDPYGFLIDVLKPLCPSNPKEDDLAKFNWISKNKKYNKLTRKGALLLTADFPPWDRAGPLHRDNARNSKLFCKRMGGYAHVIWHGKDEVERHMIPKEREPERNALNIPEKMEPDLIIVFPQDPHHLTKPERRDEENWDWKNALHGEVMNPSKRPRRVKTALNKNTDLGRRTVFFVTGKKEALKTREKALEFLDKRNDLRSKITVGMEYIPNDCVAIIQPIPSPTPPQSERERLWEEEAVKRIARAVTAGGSFRKSSEKKHGIYVRIKHPGDEKFTAAGKVSHEAWKWIQKFRKNPQSAEYALETIKKRWKGKMEKALKIEMEKDKRDRKAKLTEKKIEIGKAARKFTFPLNNKTKKYFRKLMHEQK